MKQDPREGPTIYHRPEFVVLEDDRKENASEQQQEEHYQSFFRNIKKIESTWIVRLVAFFVFFIILAVSILSLFFVTLNFLLAALGLFRSAQINEAAYKSWKNFKKIMVGGLGLGIAVFSPTLGLGLIFLYFLLNGESIDSRYTSRFMNKP